MALCFATCRCMSLAPSFLQSVHAIEILLSDPLQNLPFLLTAGLRKPISYIVDRKYFSGFVSQIDHFANTQVLPGTHAEKPSGPAG